MCCCFDEVSLRKGSQGGVQSESTYSNLQHQLVTVVLSLNGVENGRELLAIELH